MKPKNRRILNIITTIFIFHAAGVILISCMALVKMHSLGPDKGFMVKVGEKAPDDFPLKLTDGSTTSLKALKGKVVVLQFAASWCKVCREKAPLLDSALWQHYKDKNFMLIAVDRNEPLSKAIKFKSQIKINYPMALDPGADIFGKFASKRSGVSKDIVIDQNGKIVFESGPYDKKDFENMVDVVKGLLSKS